MQLQTFLRGRAEIKGVVWVMPIPPKEILDYEIRQISIGNLSNSYWKLA